VKYTLLIFAATWISVFTLGLQSLNVNQGHYLAAAVTSFFIGTGHILLYKFMPGADLVELAAYYLGGITGITASIWFHKRAKVWLAAWRARRGATQRPPKAPPPQPHRRLPDEHCDVAHCGAIKPNDTH